MSKKKLKKLLRKAIKKSQKMPSNLDAGFGGNDSAGSKGFASGFGLNGKNAGGAERGWLAGLGLPRGFGFGQTDQFVVGALLGAATAYVLSDEALRSKIMKSAMKLYAGFSGGVEEFKEQVADLKAEIEAEQRG